MDKLKKVKEVEGKKEIKYGRIMYEDKLCGYCAWKWNSHKNELISIPYGPLIHLVNGEKVKTTKFDVLLWTEVAGWLGTDDLVNRLKEKK